MEKVVGAGPFLGFVDDCLAFPFTRHQNVASYGRLLMNSFTAKVTLMHPKKIGQSQLRHCFAKAVSELRLHYFLFHLAKNTIVCKYC